MSLIKLHIYIFFLLGSLSAMAQTLPDYGLNRVRIALTDKQIVAELNPVSAHIKAKGNLWYYWYDANVVHSTQGGFGGKLLNGLYEEFFINKNLETQGHFKKGLKDGDWRQWDEKGNLTEITHWKNGVLHAEKPVPLWKRLPLLKKKKLIPGADTVKKPG